MNVHSTRLASLKNFNYHIFEKNFNYYTIICVLILLYKCPHNTILPYMRPHECIFFLRLLYMCPHTIMCVLILLHTSPPTDIRVLILLDMCPVHVLMRVKGTTNAYVWYTGVLGEVGDVSAVVERGKLDGKHLSMMLSLVSTDPALP